MGKREEKNNWRQKTQNQIDQYSLNAMIRTRKTNPEIRKKHVKKESFSQKA